MQKHSATIFWILATVTLVYIAFLVRRYYRATLEILGAMVGTLEKLR